MAQTLTVVAVTAVAALVLRWQRKRWYESIVLVTAIGGELLIFLAVTAVVSQRRPPVHRLDPAPTTSSCPSGHTGAAKSQLPGRSPAIRAIRAELTEPAVSRNVTVR
ncbi:MAG TPA: hypothetical protein VMU94_22870 [Streptosporangiaceae bacterium]|nr:hypothetical protein [Streptosporangiaceae bacterium]